MTQKIRSYLIILMAMLSLVPAAVVAQSSAASTKVGVMLPLHNVDGDGRRMVEYYRGILMAVEALKADGSNITVHAWNVPVDADIRATLLKEGASDCNIIFGPLYTKQVKQLGDFCKAYGIKMVIPFSISGNDVDKNAMIYQVYQSPDELNTNAIKRISEQFADYHKVFIDCNDSTSRKWAFTGGLRKVLDQKKQTYSITNVSRDSETFAKAFSMTKPNLVIINSGRNPELTSVLNKLDVLSDDNKNLNISLFGYTEWLMYAKNNKERFAKYNAYVPTYFYYNDMASATKEFEADYRRNFGEDMQYALPHFALTGYDHAMYFIGNRRTWLQTPLSFEKQSNGGYRNRAFMIIHYRDNGGIEALSF